MQQPTVVDLTSLSDSDSKESRASGSRAVAAIQPLSKSRAPQAPDIRPFASTTRPLAPCSQGNANLRTRTDHRESRKANGRHLDNTLPSTNGCLEKTRKREESNPLFLQNNGQRKYTATRSATNPTPSARRSTQLQTQPGVQTSVASFKSGTFTKLPPDRANALDDPTRYDSNLDARVGFYHLDFATRGNLDDPRTPDESNTSTPSFSLYNQNASLANHLYQNPDEHRYKRPKIEGLDSAAHDHQVAAPHLTGQPLRSVTRSPKRRGRPPGSRNKDKLGNGPLLLEPRTSIEPRNTSTRSCNNGPLVVHFPCTMTRLSRASIIRRRESGGHPGFNQRVLQMGLRQSVLNGQFSPWKSWEGASKDIITTAWSPNGLHFAAGASTDLDTLNLRYNRNNNLLWADIEHGSISELVDHHIPRSLPNNIPEASGTTTAHNTLDQRVFTTVSSIKFNNQGTQMYSGSYDHSVKVWEVSDDFKPPKCVTTIRHTSRVELISGHEQPGGNVLATAQCNSQQPISLWRVPVDNLQSPTLSASFSSERVKRQALSPTALSWGTIPAWTEHLLVAGFAENKNDAFDRDRQGDLLVWDANSNQTLTRLTPAAQCVFDVAWHPRLTIMAAATTPSGLFTTKSTKSVIRTWKPLESPSRIMEFECPALDINEILFNPIHENYIGAACTNGCAYVWDVRRPDDVLGVMQHGDVIEQLDENRQREEQDTGMRFMSWSPDGSSLYTGSSDGVIKQWNPFINQENCLVRDVATFDSGVMAGSFSPDGSNLLIGLCKGSVQVLSAAAPCQPADTATDFAYEAAR